MPRALIWLIAVPLIIIVAAALIIPLFLNEEKLIAAASQLLYKETGATLEVNGESGLSIFPRLAVRLGDASITLPEDKEPSVSVRSLAIGIELLPLVANRVEIGEISLDGLVAVLQTAPEEPPLDTTKLSDQELDAFYAERRSAKQEAGEAAAEESAHDHPVALNIQRLSVVDSRIEQFDKETGERNVIELVSLQTRDFNLGGIPMPLDAVVKLAGEDGAAPVEIALDGEVSLDQLSALLSLEALQLVVKGATVEPIRLEAKGQVEFHSQIAQLQLAIDIGETHGNGTVRYASFESPQIEADLHLNLFDPLLLALAGPEAAQSQPAEDSDSAGNGEGNGGDEPLPLGAIRSIDTRAKLVIDKAIFGAHQITDLKAKLRVVEGVATLNSLTGDLHGGKLDLKAKFNGKHSSARLNTKGSLSAMNIATALVAMESEPVLTGNANLNWQLSSEGKTVNGLIAALKGPVNIAATDAVLQDMSIEGMLCQAVAMANQESLSNTLPADSSFETLSVKLKLQDGKARLTPLKAKLAHAELNGEGRLHLLEQNFSAKFAARLSPELAELDPACRVNERITDIEWPVECKGSISGDPADWCSVDTEEILTDLLANEGKRKLEKEAGKLFDKLIKR